MYITKFRLSDHYLPIERGRYMKPKIPRHERTCTLCKLSVGDEIHALFLCKSDTLYDIRQIYMKQITDTSSQIFVLSDKDKLYYLLKGIDTEITPIFGKWLCEINKAHRPKSKTWYKIITRSMIYIQGQNDDVIWILNYIQSFFIFM